MLTSQRYASSTNIDTSDKPDMVKKPSHLKLPPPYVRHEPKTTPDLIWNSNQKVERITLDQKKSEIEANKNLIKQLYDEKLQLNVKNPIESGINIVQNFQNVQPQSQRSIMVDENQKGFGENVRHRITDGSHKKIPNET